MALAEPGLLRRPGPFCDNTTTDYGGLGHYRNYGFHALYVVGEFHRRWRYEILNGQGTPSADPADNEPAWPKRPPKWTAAGLSSPIA